MQTTPRERFFSLFAALLQYQCRRRPFAPQTIPRQHRSKPSANPSRQRCTEDNADIILSGLPEEAHKPFRKKRLIGRTWIRFRESMVEAKHDVINSGGPITTDSAVAAQDRALRQSMIAAFWMADVDVKEDNHRAVWTKNFAGKSGDQYLKFFHDPGSSLGGAQRSGEINKLNYQYGTGDFLWLNPLSISLYSDSFQIYRPAAGDHTNFANQLSGVGHLARITQAEIREAVRHSHMPDFYQESLVWRLIKRRDLLAKVYGVPLRNRPAGEAPTIAVPLTTRAAAAKYRVPLSEIETDLVRTRHLDPATPTAAPQHPSLIFLRKRQPSRPTTKLCSPESSVIFVTLPASSNE